MDIQDYIQSGILESYVLGLASPEEIAEVDTLRLQYAEIGQAIDEFSLMLEEIALASAVAPPAYVKESILEAIKNEEQATADTDETPAAPVVHITFFRRWRMVAAASVILLIASSALNFYLYNKFSHLHSEYLSLKADIGTLQANNTIYQTKLSQWQNVSDMMADPDMAIVKMKNPPQKAVNIATVFWNTKNKEVYVMANRLPPPSAGKQYQLWALVDGKPIDAGMISPDCTISACKMKTMLKAQAFAITLENVGGSPAPHLDQLYVMGNVSGNA